MSNNPSEKNKPDYKNTLQLPVTEFPMKANLPQTEPLRIAFWEETEIYLKMIARNKGRPKFSLADGPPYANAPLHIGHVLNKTLKDIIIKYKNMSGFEAPFVPGWDCHGLPIEHSVTKNLGEKAKTITDAQIRQLCRDEALKWVQVQKDQFRRLGILSDWQNPYLTLAADYEAEEVREFARAFDRGLIYLGNKPVYWNWFLKTALADAEVEYHPHKSPSIYVKFFVQDSESLRKLKSPKLPIAFVIWTTTPWTLPANLGISVHPDFDYGVYESDGELLIVAAALKDSFEKETSKKLQLRQQFKGKELEFLKAQHPFLNQSSLLMIGNHVTLDAGTGCVHTAPGHGMDDYKVGLKYGLPVYSPVDEKGCFTSEVPEFEGIHIFKANPLIIEKLKNSGHLIFFKEFTHSFPHCWRSKTPLIYRATPQWFLALDLEPNSLRTNILEKLNEVKFFPEWGRARFQAMMENRPDWCLTRQRIWGVPLPIFYCNKTGIPLTDVKIMMKVADIMEKEGGIEAFDKYPAEFFIGDFKPGGEHGPEFGSEGFRKGKDILDVWFDSGVCHAAVLKKRAGYQFPADIYLEGSDQHRGWFNTSMLTSMATTGVPPFKSLLTHGFVMDSQGLKMSKSKGNAMDPQEIAAKSGAEILRLWTVYEDYGQDLTCGPTELERVTETYRRIRNTLRYLLGATNDFSMTNEAVKLQEMPQIDQWMLHRLYDLNRKVKEAFETFAFYKVYHLLNSFFTVDLSAVYLDVLKDRTYTWEKQGRPRKSTQTVIWHLLDHLVRMMAPILSFLSEEAYSYMKDTKAESVFLLSFPQPNAEWKNEALEARFEKLIKVREEVQKKLEVLRAKKEIGSSLEAQVSIQCDADTFELLKEFDAPLLKTNSSLEHFFSALREFLIVSQVEITSGTFQVTAKKADGDKCVRCWIYSVDTNHNSHFPEVCGKCVEALK